MYIHDAVNWVLIQFRTRTLPHHRVDVTSVTETDTIVFLRETEKWDQFKGLRSLLVLLEWTTLIGQTNPQCVIILKSEIGWQRSMEGTLREFALMSKLGAGLVKQTIMTRIRRSLYVALPCSWFPFHPLIVAYQQRAARVSIQVGHCGGDSKCDTISLRSK